MTVSSTIRRAGPYLGNGVNTQFPFSFKVFAQKDVQVILTQAGQETMLELGTDYTVDLNTNQDYAPGGVVTYHAAGSALAANQQLHILSVLPYEQPTDIQNQGGFYPQVIEDALDRNTIQIQQLAEGVSRAIKVPVSSSLSVEEFVKLLFQAQEHALASATAAEASEIAAAASALSASIYANIAAHTLFVAINSEDDEEDYPVAGGSDAIAIGLRASATEDDAIAIGSDAKALEDYTIAIGRRAEAAEDDAIAIGYHAVADGDSSVAIGEDAQATGDSSVAIGEDALADAPYTVSVGSANIHRRIVNVAYGIHTTDVATVGQIIPIHSIYELPPVYIGPILVAEACEVWTWVSTPYYTGYRSPLCGRPVDGHTLLPLVNEIDAVGGLISKDYYAGLWGYAQENGLVVSQNDWFSGLGAHWFVDVSNTQFRVPDLRNQFRRYAGIDADALLLRELGTRQIDAIREHTHRLRGGNGNFSPGNSNYSTNWGSSAPVVGGTAPFGGVETRPLNTAYHPRIHI